MHFCSWRYNDGGLGTLKFTAANSPCPSTLLQLAADASWSGTTIKYGMAPNPDRHKIVFARAYNFDTIPLAGSCSTLVASCFPTEVRKSAREPARALDVIQADALSVGSYIIRKSLDLMDSMAL